MDRRAIRLLIEVTVLGVLLLVILRNLTLHALTESGLLWYALIIIPAMAVGGYFYRRHVAALAFAQDVDYLRSALWDLVRLMENYPTKSSGRRGAGRAELLERFAVRGAKEVAAGREMPMGNTGALDYTRLGFELIDRNEKDGSGHWRRVNGVRRGCYAMIALIELESPPQAFRAVIDHMKRQRDNPEGMDNFPELKALFGLPRAVPQPDWDWLESAEITFERFVALQDLVRRGLAPAFHKLVYKPWPDGNAPEVAYEGREILIQMREYIR